MMRNHFFPHHASIALVVMATCHCSVEKPCRETSSFHVTVRDLSRDVWLIFPLSEHAEQSRSLIAMLSNRCQILHLIWGRLEIAKLYCWNLAAPALSVARLEHDLFSLRRFKPSVNAWSHCIDAIGPC